MAVSFLRRRRLGKTSVNGMIERMNNPVHHIRSWISREMDTLRSGDLVIRWGCTATVDSGRVLNTAAAIHEVNNKGSFRMKLQEHGLCPDTWRNGRPLQYPVIVRRNRHAQGRGIYVCNNEHDYDLVIDRLNRQGQQWYASTLIDKVAEYRVFVVQGRAVAVAQKIPADENAVAWKVAQGGRFENVRWDDWNVKVVKVSIEAFNLSSLDFGGVDVMVDADGKTYVLEINSAPSLTSDYRQSCMAKAFDYIIKYGKDRIPLVEERGGYRKFIHPAVCDRAQLPSPEVSDIEKLLEWVVANNPDDGSGYAAAMYDVKDYIEERLIC